MEIRIHIKYINVLDTNYLKHRFPSLRQIYGLVLTLSFSLTSNRVLAFGVGKLGGTLLKWGTISERV